MSTDDQGPSKTGGRSPRTPRTPRRRQDPSLPSTPVDPQEDLDPVDPDRTQALPTGPPEQATLPYPAGEQHRTEPAPEPAPAVHLPQLTREDLGPRDPGPARAHLRPGGTDIEILRADGRSRRPALVLRALGALLAVAACIVGTIALQRTAVDTARGQRLDQLILSAAQGDSSLIARIVYPAIETVTWEVIIGILVAAGIFCLARRRVGLLLQLMLLVIGSNVTTQIMKHFLVGRDVLAEGIEITPNSFPSGHTTLAAAAAVAIVLAVPSWMRSITAILAVVWTVAAGIGTMAQGWHRPSDVAGAILIVGAWTFLTILVDAGAAAADSEGVRAPGPGRRSGRIGTVLLLAVAVVSLVAAAVVGLSIPVPLELDDVGHQASAYAASILAILGGTSGLVGVVLFLRVEHSPR